MTVLLTVNTLFYLCIALFILLATVWLYARNINKRLAQSINLINDLYKLSQNQANTISELVGDTKGLGQADEASNNTRVGLSSATDHLVQKTALEVKSSISEDLALIEARTLKSITDCTGAIEQRILALENQTLQLQQESPELKLYNRANKLVKEGASVEDVMQASQLPRAEVEVLVGLHSHKKKPS